jgi:membrane protein required for colicin V production
VSLDIFLQNRIKNKEKRLYPLGLKKLIFAKIGTPFLTSGFSILYFLHSFEDFSLLLSFLPVVPSIFFILLSLFYSLYSLTMSFLDIVLGSLLLYALYKGIKNGLFIELASLISLLLGIYVAIKFSYVVRKSLAGHVSWSPKYIEIIAFALTFISVVLAVHLLAKVFTGIMDFAFLGWVNKLAGGFFSVIKNVLLLSILFNLFQKVNINNMIVKEETLDSSIFYNPIQETSKYIYPSLETWYTDFKNKKQNNPV